MMENRIHIVCREANPIIDFAAQELKKYLRMMMPQRGDIYIGACPEQEGFHLGLLETFGVTEENIDPQYDDVLYIDVKGEQGVIAGSNPRSVLLAVYRYLYLCGCRWPRPGVDGELIPRSGCVDAQYRHKASNRHRGICIEGAVSQQNMLDNVDWAPKVGYNSYFMEFGTPYIFYDRWYHHRKSTHRPSEKVSLENVQQFCAAVEIEIKKRGLNYHAVGHAWTCEPFGIPGNKWDEDENIVNEDTRQYLAMLNGKRDLFQKVNLNTQICMSNSKARDILVQYCADYAQRNTQIDYMHVWLGDSFNNHCECDECRKQTPSDFYVTLLNEIDAEYTKRNIPTKVVLIVYYETLWAPLIEKFSNHDRFLYLFAPITRNYASSYSADAFKGTLPPLILNQMTMPADVQENIAHIRSWQKVAPLDGFVYEYYFWLEHYNDMGYYDFARIISGDVKALHGVGLNGIISDQTQRSFFPTGFPMYLMGQTLYDDSNDFDQLAREFFTDCYGQDGEKCRAYMEELSGLSQRIYLKGQNSYVGKITVEGLDQFVSPEAAEKLSKIKPLVQQFRSTIEANLNSGIRCKDLSWRYLLIHADICEMFSEACVARAKGDFGKAHELWESTKEFIWQHEHEIQEVFDAYEFVTAHDSRFTDNYNVAY